MNSINEKDIDFAKKKKRIIEELLKGGLIKPGQLIDYEQFSNLHELYKYLMNEKEFAVALEITTERLWGIKNGGRTRILKGVQGELVRIKGMQKTDLG